MCAAPSVRAISCAHAPSLCDGRDHRTAGGEVRRELAGQRHVAQARALVHEQDVGGVQQVGIAIARHRLEKADVAEVRGEVTQCLPLVAVAAQHDPDLGAPFEHARGLDDVAEILLQAHVAGVQDDVLVVAPAELGAHCCPLFLRMRHVCPVRQQSDLRVVDAVTSDLIAVGVTYDGDRVGATQRPAFDAADDVGDGCSP